MKSIKLIVIAILLVNSAYSQIFTQETSVVDDFFFPSMDWADYDNDGDKDLVISGGVDTSGDYSADISSIKIYTNNNGVLSVLNTPDVYNLHLGFVKFLDIDNDNDLDLITAGQNYNDITTYYCTVYENDNGSFTEKQQLEGVIYSSLDYGDYDNDGDLDLLITGAYQSTTGTPRMTRIYTNTNGTFTDSTIALPGVQNGNAEFGDFDNDGDLDVLVMGLDVNDAYILKTLFNTNAIYTEEQSLPGMYLGGFALGDYDNDGDLDFATMGDDTNDDYASKIYTNTAGNFTELTTLTGIDSSSGTTPIGWGDFDNDGDLDLVAAGTDVDYNDKTYLYENNNGVFATVNEGLVNLGGNTSLKWVDYDNDNDLDILISGFFDDANYASQTVVHKNNVAVVNSSPSVPSNLISTINADNSITFSWDSATDDFTPATGLYYWLSIGTTNNGVEVASYKVYGNSWTIKNLNTSVNYYWSVNAVDTAFVMSNAAVNETLGVQEFNSNNSFTIYPNPSTDKKINLVYNVNRLNTNNNTIVIFSNTGQKVFETTLKSNSDFYNKTVDLSALSSGMYILQFNSGEYTATRKIILE